MRNLELLRETFTLMQVRGKILDVFIVALQFVVAAILALAAVGKMMDLPGSRQAVRDFGVPVEYANPLGTALPFGELALAILLIPGVSARWAALGAFLLFGTFIVAISYNLMHGRQPDCHCFGTIQSSPAIWQTVARNCGFALLAAIVVIAGGRSPIETVNDLSGAGRVGLLVALLILALSAVQGWFLIRIWKRQGEVISGLDAMQTAPLFAGLGGPAGTAPNLSATPVPGAEAKTAPAFDIPSMTGGRLMLSGLLEQGKPTLLYFISPDCGHCMAMLPEVADWNTRFAADMMIAVIGQGEIEENRSKLEEFRLANVGIQDAREVSDAYGIGGTPSGVIVMPDGTIRGEIGQGRPEIEKLVGQMLREQALQKPTIAQPVPAKTMNSKINDDEARPAPSFDIPTPDGGRLSLNGLLARQKPVLLIFWSTTCGFCERLAPEAAEWGRRFADDVTVAIISGGTNEQNQAHIDQYGLTNLGVQEAGEVQQRYGTAGTPTAVLVQPDGFIHDPVATGGPEIRRLLGRAVSRGGAVIAATSALTAVPVPDETEEEVIRRTLLKPVAGPDVGTPGSRLPLPDLDGAFVGLDEYLGDDLIVVFWDVDCVFSQRMLPDLKEWEEEAGEAISRVLIASQGDIEANRAQGLKSRIVLDDAFVTAAGFGASGTPAAIKLDSEGRVASDLAVGADGVLDLLYDVIEQPEEILTASTI